MIIVWNAVATVMLPVMTAEKAALLIKNSSGDLCAPAWRSSCLNIPDFKGLRSSKTRASDFELLMIFAIMVEIQLYTIMSMSGFQWTICHIFRKCRSRTDLVPSPDIEVIILNIRSLDNSPRDGQFLLGCYSPEGCFYFSCGSIIY